MPGLEVWFQRASDVVRKLMYGDVDIGIMGADMFAEIANGDPSLVMLHDALNFGKCHLALGLPTGGKFAHIESLEALRRRAHAPRRLLRCGRHCRQPGHEQSCDVQSTPQPTRAASHTSLPGTAVQFKLSHPAQSQGAMGVP